MYLCSVKRIDQNNCVIYSGEYFSVEWYFDKEGYSQAYEYFLSIDDSQKRKFLILVKRIADFGKIFDKTKFRNEGDGIFAFKPQPDRYLAFFVIEKKIIVTNAFYKNTDKLPQSEKELALKYKEHYLNKK